MTERELLALKQKIESAEKDAAQLEGQKKYLYQQLKEQFDCETIEQAEALLDKMDAQITKQEKELKDAIGRIEETYN
jgi:hypothetical protein